MTWTYDPNITTDRDKVRLNIGDTNTSSQLLSDEEIAYFLTQAGVLGASVLAAEAIAAKFSALCDQQVGDLSVTFSQKAKQYRELAKQLRRQIGLSSAGPIAPAISISDKDTAELDTDRVEPAFTIGMDDNKT